MKIRYTSKALAQIEKIHEFIARDNPAAEKAVVARIRSSIARVARFPYNYRATDRPGIRVVAVVRYPYLVFYTVDEDAQELQILRIRHSSQNPSEHLK